jgi:hypothetical protein
MERGTPKSNSYCVVVIAAPEGIAYTSSNIYQIIATYGLLILMKN